MNICLNCNKPTNKPKFCNSSCAAVYNNTHRKYRPSNDKRTKNVKCCNCGIVFIGNIRSGINSKCDKCRVYVKNTDEFRRRIICPICGSWDCKRKICKYMRRNIDWLVDVWGVPRSSVGTYKIFDEIEKLKRLIYDEYINQKLSLQDIANKYGSGWHVPVSNLLRLFDIPRRDIGNAIRNAISQGKGISQIPFSNYQFKHGWHTTWNNEQVFLRSSYEFRYAEELDKNQIPYKVESLRIPYTAYDGIQRTYIPDFYLINENKIVEVKSSYTIDENTKIKLDACRKLGYNTEIVIYDKSQS